MTKEQAREKAETRVYCYMNKGDIDYYFEDYELEVLGKNGRPKKSPSRCEKEQAIIDYLADLMTTEPDEKVERSQKCFEERFKHDIGLI